MRNLHIFIFLLIGIVAIAQPKPELRKVELYDKKVTILLPASFTPMLAAEIAKRYDPTSPPDYVYSGTENNANIAFSNSYQQAPTDEAGMVALVKSLKESLEQTHPAMFWVGTNAATQTGKVIGQLEFKSLTPDNIMVYNVLYLLPVNSQVVIANFSCECSSADALVAAGKEVLASIKFVK